MGKNSKIGIVALVIIIILILLFSLPVLFINNCYDTSTKKIDDYEESKHISNKEYEEYRKKAARDPGQKKEWYEGCD